MSCVWETCHLVRHTECLPLKEANSESGKITQPGSTNRSEHSSRDVTHIDQRSFNQPATSSVEGKEGQRGTGGVNVRWRHAGMRCLNTFLKYASFFFKPMILAPPFPHSLIFPLSAFLLTALPPSLIIFHFPFCYFFINILPKQIRKSISLPWHSQRKRRLVSYLVAQENESI